LTLIGEDTNNKYHLDFIVLGRIGLWNLLESNIDFILLLDRYAIGIRFNPDHRHLENIVRLLIKIYQWLEVIRF